MRCVASWTPGFRSWPPFTSAEPVLRAEDDDDERGRCRRNDEAVLQPAAETGYRGRQQRGRPATDEAAQAQTESGSDQEVERLPHIAGSGRVLVAVAKAVKAVRKRVRRTGRIGRRGQRITAQNRDQLVEAGVD